MTIINEQEIVAPQESESDIVLSVNGVSKKYCRDLKRSLMYGVQDIYSELLGLREQNDKLRKKEFWALNDVSFQLKKGEALGLVGKNGSGKSTLLRIIAGLIKPDTGYVEVNGRVAPLIALGAGFNPILTGRENIYANMAILGLSKKEIDERFDEVVEFAEIGDAIDAPVQSYSSGMAARLGFASAVHTNPDILLIDEVLAVGDARFRNKCSQKLQKIRREGTSFVFVSHYSTSLLSICESSIYLSNGKIVKSGSTYQVIKQYEQDLFATKLNGKTGKIGLIPKNEKDSNGIDITHILFEDNNRNHVDSFEVGEPMTISVRCKVHKRETNVFLGVEIRDLSRDREIILNVNSIYDHKSVTLEAGEHELKVFFPYCAFKPGTYEMDVYLYGKHDYNFDTVESLQFEIKDSNKIMTNWKSNLFYQPCTWRLDSSKNN